MKVLKFVLKFFILPIIVLTMSVVIYFTIHNKLYLGSENQTNVNYLKLHSEILDRNHIDFNSFDSTFYSNNIFVLSENHGYEDVQTIDEALLMHLNKKLGVRYYIAEMDSLRARRLNAFLKNVTPDTSLLKSVARDIALRIPQQSSQQLFNKWMHLHAYNVQLKTENKIEVLGLDQNFDDETAKIGRDSSMLLNLKNYVETKHLQHEKFYGLFGYFHGMQSGVTETNRYPFAAKLKRYAAYPPFQKVQTLTCLTLESEMYIPKLDGYPTPPENKTDITNMNGPFILVKGINDLKAASQPNSISLYHLDVENSPYRKSQNLAGVNVNLISDKVLPNNDKQVTTDFYQHVFLLRGSKSLRPLK